MYYSAIGLLALALLLIENQDILFHPNEGFDKPAWKVYKSFLISVIVYYVSDVLWGIFGALGAVDLQFFDTSVYFVAMAAGVALWAQYFVTYLDEKSVFERFFLHAGRAVAGLAMFVTIINVVYPILFTFGADGVYQPLGSRYVILGSQLVLLFLMAAYAFGTIARRRPAKQRSQRLRIMGFFGLIMSVFLCAQILDPYLPMYAVAYMLGTSLLRASVIGAEKEQYRLGMEEATRVAELRQSITSLLDNMPALSFSKDVDTGAYLACNQSFAEYAHKEAPAGVVGHTDFELFDQATAAHFVEDDRKALTMDRPHVFYEDVFDAEGNPRQLQTTKLKFYDSVGRTCLLGMSMDVTETERAKEAYQRALSTSTVYQSIVEALSGDYFNLYYIDLETDDYIEYGLRAEEGHQAMERHGTNFFATVKASAQDLIYVEDRDALLEAFEKERLLGEIRKNGTAIIQYRLLVNGTPTYVNLKATFASGDDRHLIIGVNNIDAQVKDRAAALRTLEEHKLYARLSALNGNLIVLYYVDLENNHYTEYGATESYEKLGIAKQGSDFFRETYINSFGVVFGEDQELFQKFVTRENILRAIEHDGLFTLDYRIMNGDRPVYVRLKAAKLMEEGKDTLIVGVMDEDAQVRRDQEYAHDLSVAQRMASIDALTGVKNKHAYAQWEERINVAIERGEQDPFAVVVCDINGLKLVNDLRGHDEGDACIKRNCLRICRIFTHSPVFRVGGDEFVVLLMGEDYTNRRALTESAGAVPGNAKDVRAGDTISAGMMEFDKARHDSLRSVFKEADKIMYEQKQAMKQRMLGAMEQPAGH